LIIISLASPPRLKDAAIHRGGENRDFCVFFHIKSQASFKGNMWENDDYLVGGLEHDFYDFPYIGNNHTN